MNIPYKDFGDLIRRLSLYNNVKYNRKLLIELEEYSKNHPDLDEFKVIEKYFSEKNINKNFFEIHLLGESLIFFKNEKELISEMEKL